MYCEVWWGASSASDATQRWYERYIMFCAKARWCVERLSVSQKEILPANRRSVTTSHTHSPYKDTSTANLFQFGCHPAYLLHPSNVAQHTAETIWCSASYRPAVVVLPFVRRSGWLAPGLAQSRAVQPNAVKERVWRGKLLTREREAEKVPRGSDNVPSSDHEQDKFRLHDVGLNV